MSRNCSNCRGERLLLTKGVNLFNSYLMGEEGEWHSGLRISWRGFVGGCCVGALSGWGFTSCRSHHGVLSFFQCHSSLGLSGVDYQPALQHFIHFLNHAHIFSVKQKPNTK